MKIREIITPVVTIFLISAILLCTAVFLAPISEKNQISEQNKTMRKLLPGGKTFSHIEYLGDDINISSVYQSENGYVIETIIPGYADKITLWVGVSDSGTVTGLTVRTLAETAGLGKRALSSRAFLSQFLGTKGDAEIGVKIDALSGATVTSRAIAKGVNSAVGFVTGADISTNATEWGH